MASRRGLIVSVTNEYAVSLFEGRCALTGVPIELNVTASLDRIDSSLGYIEGNLQWLHKDINRMKSDWNQNDFIEMCRRVADYGNQR